GLGLVIVDYLQLMRSDDPRANRVEQVGQKSRGLKILARELSVPVLAISQLSRAPEQRHPPKPQLSDLRESGQLEQDADLVGFLYREDYYRDPEDEPAGLAALIIAKHRNGPIGTRKLVFLDRFPKFADYSGQERPIEQPAGVGAAPGDLAAGGPDFYGGAGRRSSGIAPARWGSATARAGSSARRTWRGPASAGSSGWRGGAHPGAPPALPPTLHA